MVNDQVGDGDSCEVRNKSLKSEMRFGAESAVTKQSGNSSHGKASLDSESLPKENGSPNGLVGPGQMPALTMAKAPAALAFVTPRASQPGTEEDSATATCPSYQNQDHGIS